MLSTSASAPQCAASWRAMPNQKPRTSSGRGKAFTKPTYSAIVFFSSSMAMSSTSRIVARRARCRAARTRLLPGIFAGLEPVTAVGDLFGPITWLRRGRLRPVVDVVADVQAGLSAEGDDLSPGADAALPAVSLRDAPPPDEPVVLRLPAGT